MNRRTPTILAVCAAAIAPVGLEKLAAKRIGAAIADCPGPVAAACGGLEGIDLELLGARLDAPWIERHGHRVGADTVEVWPHPSHVAVHIEGLTLARAPVHTSAAASPKRAATAPARTSWTVPRIPVRLEVVAPGSMTIELPSGVSLTVFDLEIGTDPRGEIRGRFAAEVHRGPAYATTARRATVRVGDDEIGVAATLSVQGGPPFAVDAVASAKDPGRALVASAILVGDAGGRLEAEAEIGPRAASLDLSLVASEYELAAWEPSLAPVLPRGIDLGSSRVHGTLGASLRPGRFETHASALTIEGLRVDDARLARESVAFGPVTVDGSVSVSGERAELDLSVGHAALRGSVWARRDGDDLQLLAGLPPTDCDDLVAGVPAAFAGMLRGTRLSGELDAGVRLQLSMSELERARASELMDAAPLGQLEVRLPFLERCQTLTDPPAFDGGALAGAYRHQFVDGLGQPRTRWLTAGAPEFVALRTVPLLARAFVTLEDSRFWKHDGFDREQMHNALWHNVVAGRVERGASTITQQTARNLFLGIDRSVSRKLQEAYLATRLEHALSKSRILEIYLNIIELGPGVHGVEQAAQFYFGKSAAELDLLQAVHLASLAPAPHRYAQRFADATVDSDWLEGLRAQVRRMYLHRLISRGQLQHALGDALELRDRTAPNPTH